MHIDTLLQPLSKTATAFCLIAIMVAVFIVGAVLGMWSWVPDFWLFFWSAVVVSTIARGRFGIAWFSLCAVGCAWIAYTEFGNEKWGRSVGLGFYFVAILMVIAAGACTRSLSKLSPDGPDMPK